MDQPFATSLAARMPHLSKEQRQTQQQQQQQLKQWWDQLGSSHMLLVALQCSQGIRQETGK